MSTELNPKDDSKLVKKDAKLDQKEKSGSSNTSWWKATTQFLHEVWVEVRPNNGRVSWPTFESVKISTKVVIFSSLGLGLFIGLLDMLFSHIYTAIIGGPGIG